MKKTKLLSIVLMVVLMVILMTIKVEAVNAKVQLGGDNEVKIGETKTVSINVANDVEVGVVQGKLSFDSNIEDVEVVSSYNGWTTTYNKGSGEFNTFNAAGTKNGGVLQIKYKLKDAASSTTVTLSDIELTTIEYNTIPVSGNVTKTINKAKDVKPTEPDNKDDDQTNKDDKDKEDKKDTDKKKEERPQTVPAKDNKNNGSNSENTKTQQNNNPSDKKLPKTGKSVCILVIIAGLIIVSIVIYKKNKYYKDV